MRSKIKYSESVGSRGRFFVRRTIKREEGSSRYYLAERAKKERNEYPTFDDVHSDWEGPSVEMHRATEKKPVESN